VTAKVERLVNLTIALLEARRPQSLDELRRRTGYYDQADRESARRMFERDKGELRRLGVPIETVPIGFSDELGYQVPRRAYELPDVDLTAEEVAALALAVRVTGVEGTPLALAKLAARAPDPSPLPAPSARVVLAAEPVDAVADAVVERRTISFGYRTADGATGTRTLDPYAIVQRRAAWYLVGRDHDREAVRAFRLDRVVEPPRAVSDPGAFEVPDDLDVAAAVSGPELAGTDVTLAVGPGATWPVEVRGGRRTDREHAGWPVYELSGLHPWRDRSWVLGLGAEVVVLDPPELRTAVVDALDAVLGGAS
jgi:proteasome accessory factor B